MKGNTSTKINWAHVATLHGPFGREAVQLQLASMLPHDRAYAETRLGWLAEFVFADMQRGGKERCKTRAEVAARLARENPNERVSIKILERLESQFTKHGVTSLARNKSRERLLNLFDTDYLNSLPIADAIARIGACLLTISQRMKQSAAAADSGESINESHKLDTRTRRSDGREVGGRSPRQEAEARGKRPVTGPAEVAAGYVREHEAEKMADVAMKDGPADAAAAEESRPE